MNKLFLRIKNSVSIMAAVKNTGWLLVEKAVRMILGLFIGIWVARYLGPTDFGLLNYSIAFVSFFGPLATLGINHIITRDLVNQRERESEILGTAFLLRIIGGSLSVILALILIHILRPNEHQVALFVGILSISQIAKAFLVIDFWFQSYVNSRPVVIARIITLIISNFFKFLGIISGFSIFWFVIAAIVENTVIDVVLLIVYKLKKQSFFSWKYSREIASRYLKSSWPLVFSGFAAVIYLKIDTIMIGQMISDTAVGVYSAASKISEVWYLVPVSIASSVFPRLLYLRSQNKVLYQQRLQSLYIILAILGFIVAIPISIFAIPLMNFLFGIAYIESGVVLRIHIWAGVFIFMRALFSKWIISENLFMLSLITHGSGAILNVLANIILIPLMGIRGAAIATLISYACASYLILFFNEKTRPTAVMMTKALFFPIFIREILGKIENNY